MKARNELRRRLDELASRVKPVRLPIPLEEFARRFERASARRRELGLEQESEATTPDDSPARRASDMELAEIAYPLLLEWEAELGLSPEPSTASSGRSSPQPDEPNRTDQRTTVPAASPGRATSKNSKAPPPGGQTIKEPRS